MSSWSHRDLPRTLLERTGRPSWTLPGRILGPTWAQLEPTWSQLGPISRQLGANLGSSWAQVASRKPSWAILRPSRGLLRHVKQEIPNFTQKMIEFCSKIDENLSQKYQKYVTIVAPNGFSTFSKGYLENHDFDLILGPIFGVFEVILAHFGGSWRLWGPILGICRPTWSQLEPT